MKNEEFATAMPLPTGTPEGNSCVPSVASDQGSSASFFIINSSFLDLPPSWYIKYNTDADRQKEIELSSLPATFSIYEED